jgi:hypothetical protein
MTIPRLTQNTSSSIGGYTTDLIKVSCAGECQNATRSIGCDKEYFNDVLRKAFCFKSGSDSI